MEAHEAEGVRTNAICMILHVLARPGCAHRVSAFCLRFPLAFLAAATSSPAAWQGGAKGLPSCCKVTGQPREMGNYFSWFFSGRAEPGRNSGILIGGQERRDWCCHFKGTIFQATPLSSPNELSRRKLAVAKRERAEIN